MALESAAGASLAGVRTLVTMKHVGLNVAADPLMTLAYTGVRGGMVIVSADDPSMHSSQNEQDNRHYARFAKVPMFEPAEQCRGPGVSAGGLGAERAAEAAGVFAHDHPCLPQQIGDPDWGARSESRALGYRKDFVTNVMVPANARIMRVELEKKLARR